MISGTRDQGPGNGTGTAAVERLAEIILGVVAVAIIIGFFLGWAAALLARVL